MAKQEIAFDLKVEGVEQSIESVKDLKNALKAAKDEQVKMANAFGESSKEYLDATKKVSGLKDKVDDLNDSTKSLKGTGVEQLTQGFSQMKEGIMNLDFDKVKTGITAMKSGIGAFATSAKTALQGFKGALLATGIGALVVALGVIVAYWDDIKGAVSGVSSEQKKLNELAAENLKSEQDKLTAISAQENILKLQGKSEKEILQIKLKQTDEAIMASDVAIQQAENTKKAQVEASQRNRDILQGIIKFVTAPITMLLQGIDSIGSAMGQNFNLLEKFSGGLANLVFDPEEVASEGDKAIAEAKAVNDKLKNDRAGLQLSVNKIDDDARKTASENAKKNAEEQKKLRDEKLAAEIAAMKQIQDANIANEQDEQKRAIKKSFLDQQRRVEEINKTVTDETLKAELLKASEKTFQNEMAAIYQTKLDKDKAAEEKAASEKKALLDQIHAQQIAQDEIDGAAMVAKAEKEKEIAQAKEDAAYQTAKNGVDSLQNLSDIYFLFKTKNLEKGSKAELEAAKKQFNVNKALQIASATIAGIQGVQNALTASSILPEPLATAFRVANAVTVGIASAANIAKIAASKFEGGGGAGGGGATVPSAAPIPPPPTIATPENNTNKNTSFDETGKNLNFQGNTTPTINVKASVGVDEITSKSNRVEVLEQQSTF